MPPIPCNDGAFAKLLEFAILMREPWTRERGREWELMTPDDAIMISDNEGVLSLDEVTEKCSECREEVNVDLVSDGLCDSCREVFDNSDYEPMAPAELAWLDCPA